MSLEYKNGFEKGSSGCTVNSSAIWQLEFFTSIPVSSQVYAEYIVLQPVFKFVFEDTGIGMKPEDLAREVIDENLKQSGWTIQDMRQLNLTAMPQTVNNLAGCKR